MTTPSKGRPTPKAPQNRPRAAVAAVGTRTRPTPLTLMRAEARRLQAPKRRAFRGIMAREVAARLGGRS